MRMLTGWALQDGCTQEASTSTRSNTRNVHRRSFQPRRRPPALISTCCTTPGCARHPRRLCCRASHARSLASTACRSTSPAPPPPSDPSSLIGRTWAARMARRGMDARPYGMASASPMSEPRSTGGGPCTCVDADVDASPGGPSRGCGGTASSDLAAYSARSASFMRSAPSTYSASSAYPASSARSAPSACSASSACSATLGERTAAAGAPDQPVLRCVCAPLALPE
mmetsp:Transcript_19189/g.56991  ORF Transcript_19189/g.56991 Transcript_19189/m.56991 type:complete len:227 (-) Transcript_19189:46-726(-)